ncbi:hypothetical protein PIB30_019762 [Stylosanthes scabra]|uniref:Uncharacterized protein n=1 Tax=Stylosanthes scabra TaxID=79078 RepID=A0ABU6X7X7_9FABA|nr:hypothetical protein [Stylosanthes scabra]
MDDTVLETKTEKPCLLDNKEGGVLFFYGINLISREVPMVAKLLSRRCSNGGCAKTKLLSQHVRRRSVATLCQRRGEEQCIAPSTGTERCTCAGDKGRRVGLERHSSHLLVTGEAERD